MCMSDMPQGRQGLRLTARIRPSAKVKNASAGCPSIRWFRLYLKIVHADIPDELLEVLEFKRRKSVPSAVVVCMISKLRS